jgi:hypothetical protein
MVFGRIVASGAHMEFYKDHPALLRKGEEVTSPECSFSLTNPFPFISFIQFVDPLHPLKGSECFLEGVHRL